ncbi:MAG TPA: TetR/AcrR family transcriptional regulator [Devosia sp.]
MRIVKSAEIRKQELLATAMRLFAAQGYEQTSINQIIAALNISKGAFYHHYSSKEDLVEALAAMYAEEAAARARSVLEDESLDAFGRLSMFLSRMRNSKTESAAELQAAFAPIFLERNRDLYERTQQAVNKVIQPILARIIAEGVADRTFDTSDAEAAAETMLHLMASTRAMVAGLYAATNQLDVQRQMNRLVDRMRYLSTVIDRILGIPEGSIELVDDASICIMTDAWKRSPNAA